MTSTKDFIDVILKYHFHFSLCSNSYDLYGADEFGSVTGEEQMMAEIFARGPIACSLNSDIPEFNAYRYRESACF